MGDNRFANLNLDDSYLSEQSLLLFNRPKVPILNAYAVLYQAGERALTDGRLWIGTIESNTVKINTNRISLL